MSTRAASLARRFALLPCAMCAVLSAAPVAGAVRGSPLAMPLVQGPGRPTLVLAQRAIVRDWGASEDTSYVEVNEPQWRSEGLAAALSAAVPGLGQSYAGEGGGVWFALAEIAGWTANRIFLHKSRTDRDRSEGFAGNPSDTASAWSFERWRQVTGLDPAEIERIWSTDRQAFYELIARDPTYLAGWDGDPEASRRSYYDLRGRSRSNFDRAASLGYALWLNHLLSAVDALRAARLHNLPLKENLELRLRSSWRGGAPAVAAALVRRF
jgi:hypothetical protein